MTMKKKEYIQCFLKFKINIFVICLNITKISLRKKLVFKSAEAKDHDYIINHFISYDTINHIKF